MGSDYNENLWKAVLKELKKTIPPKHYELWFEKTEILSLSETIIKIQVPSEIIMQKITDQYTDEIKKTIFKCSGNDPELEFIIQKKQEQQAFFNFDEESNQIQIEKHINSISNTDSSNQAQQRPLILNELYTFNNFVVGPSNQLAHAAALAVAKTPGKVYNPLFVYGSVGLGKTHLMQAICHELQNQKQNHTIVYLSCEEFINEFITAVEQGDVNGFRYKYRHVSILVIDDIHFLASKERTQEEFFHTFNTLYNANKQIIISSDSPPTEIPKLKERLVSRFKWGLVAPIDTPSFETRVAIVKKKAKQKKIELSDNTCQYIAEHMVTNIRELEGALNHLLAMAELHKKEVSFDFAKKSLREMISFRESDVQLAEILEVVANHFDVKLSDIQSKKRHKSVVFPRQISMYLAKKLTKYSLQEIGGFIGGRDHTTVLHAIDKIRDHKNNNEKTRILLDELEKEIFGTDF